MTFTGVVGRIFGPIINGIVTALALSRVHPNVLTFMGLLINIWAATVRRREVPGAGIVLIGAGLFDMVDGRVARETNRVTRFGGFFDSCSTAIPISPCWSDCSFTMRPSTATSTWC